MPTTQLEVENLHLWRAERHVLRAVSFRLAAGQCLKVTGVNGAGKTTLLRAVAGLAYAEEGTVRWCGQDVRRDLRTFHAALIYLGHEPPLKADLTARENLRYWIGTRNRIAEPELDAALARTGANGIADRPVRTLSAGQRRRAALAGVILSGAPLWLLDEPATNLDTAGQALVGSLIAEHVGRGGLVMAVVHHELPGLATATQLELAA